MQDVDVFAVPDLQDSLLWALQHQDLLRGIQNTGLPSPTWRPWHENRCGQRDKRAMEQDQWLSKFFPVPLPPRIVIGPLMNPTADKQDWNVLLVRRLADAHGYFSGTYEKVFTHAICLPEWTRELSSRLSEAMYRIWDCPLDIHAVQWVCRIFPQEGCAWIEHMITDLREGLGLWQQRFWQERSLEGDPYTDFLMLTGNIAIATGVARTLPKSEASLHKQCSDVMSILHGLRMMITLPNAAGRRMEQLALQLEEVSEPGAFMTIYEELLRGLFGNVEIRPVSNQYDSL